MNIPNTGADRANFTNIAHDITESIGTLAGPDDIIGMPRWKFEKLLSEAAERGAAAAEQEAGSDRAPSTDLTAEELLAALESAQLSLGRIAAQLRVFAESTVEDAELLCIALQGTIEICDQAMDDTDPTCLSIRKARKATKAEAQS